MTKKTVVLYLAIIGLLLVVTLGWYMYALLSQPETAPVNRSFDGLRAYSDVQTQVSFGPRISGTDAHAKAVEWIQEELVKVGWQVEIQESEALGHPIKNIVAKRNDASPRIILGAHYDTRMHADHDPNPENSLQPVPGANDGASGVAVLLELARTLPENTVDTWLVFFDAEDNGEIEGWDWILGSREFVKNNSLQPRAGIWTANDCRPLFPTASAMRRPSAI